MSEIVHLKVGEPRKCSECGNVDDLRPYGKNGAWVCFDCGMKDEDETKRQFGKLLDSDLFVIDTRKP